MPLGTSMFALLRGSGGQAAVGSDKSFDFMGGTLPADSSVTRPQPNDYRDNAGATQSAAIDNPRFDHRWKGNRVKISEDLSAVSQAWGHQYASWNNSTNKLSATTATGFHHAECQQINLPNNSTQNRFGVRAKADTTDVIWLWCSNFGFAAKFTLSGNGTMSNVHGSVTAYMTKVGDWYDCEFEHLDDTTPVNFRIYIDQNVSYTGAGESVFIDKVWDYDASKAASYAYVQTSGTAATEAWTLEGLLVDGTLTEQLHLTVDSGFYDSITVTANGAQYQELDVTVTGGTHAIGLPQEAIDDGNLHVQSVDFDAPDNQSGPPPPPPGTIALTLHNGSLVLGPEHNGQTFENLLIIAPSGQSGIYFTGATQNITIRNCEVRWTPGLSGPGTSGNKTQCYGITGNRHDSNTPYQHHDLTIENVRVIDYSKPGSRGSAPGGAKTNDAGTWAYPNNMRRSGIFFHNSKGLHLRKIYVDGGGNAIMIRWPDDSSTRSTLLEFIHVNDPRGHGPTHWDSSRSDFQNRNDGVHCAQVGSGSSGHCSGFRLSPAIQVSFGHNLTLRDFYVQMDWKGTVEDRINFYATENAVIRRGRIEGIGGRSDGAVQLESREQDTNPITGNPGRTSNFLIEDIDIMAHSSGGFAVSYSGTSGIVRRIRCRGGMNTSQQIAYNARPSAGSAPGLPVYQQFRGAGPIVWEDCEYRDKPGDQVIWSNLTHPYYHKYSEQIHDALARGDIRQNDWIPNPHYTHVNEFTYPAGYEP